MTVYERNFARLASLAPWLGQHHLTTCVRRGSCGVLCLKVVEQSRYTVTVVLTHHLETGSARVSDPEMRIRFYLDARVAEVLSYQGQFSWYSFWLPHSGIVGYVCEKRRLNHFLEDWLEHCLEQGYCFAGEISAA